MIGAVLGFFGKLFAGNFVDKVFSTIDAKIKSETDREALKRDIIVEHYRNRADWMRAGGFWLMLAFAVPLALWWSAVLVYSVLWCAGCAFPQDWTIAALPSPLNEWAWLIVASIFGVIGISKLKG